MRLAWEGSPELYLAGVRALVPSREGGRWCATLVTIDAQVAEAFAAEGGVGAFAAGPCRSPVVRYDSQFPASDPGRGTEFHLFFVGDVPGGRTGFTGAG
jgi:hypothetical protein